MNITIFVPTYKDRTKYLRRSLYFYNEMNFTGQILIGDSSEGNILDNNKELTNEFKSLNIKHIHYPMDIYPHDGYITNDIIKYIKTDFICFSGDDDFQVPATLEHCINFLKYNINYVGAHGSKIKYNISKNQIHNIRIVKGQYLDVDDPIFRFRGYMKTCTSPQYHVVRKDIWEKIYSHIYKIPNIKFLAAEVLPCSLYYILGKVKRFDNLIQYFMEQTNVSFQTENSDYIIKGINSDGWGKCSTAIRKIIIDELIKQGCNKEKSERAFDEEYNYRILSHFSDQFESLYRSTFEPFNEEYYKFNIEHDKQDNLKESYFKECMQTIIPSISEFLNKEGLV
jgi:glycosyltransferase domain-containing protein